MELILSYLIMKQDYIHNKYMTELVLTAKFVLEGLR
jgi:hypothetical protein